MDTSTSQPRAAGQAAQITISQIRAGSRVMVCPGFGRQPAEEVVVVEAHADIKNGRPGIDYTDKEGGSRWAYLSQVTEILESAHTLPRLAVMACPDHAGKHPFHDQRWIVTEGAEVEFGHDPRPGQWSVRNGSLVAQMRDCELGTAQAIVTACNSRAALVNALTGAEKALTKALPHCPADTDAHFVGEWLGEVRAALAAAKEGQ